MIKDIKTDIHKFVLNIQYQHFNYYEFCEMKNPWQNLNDNKERQENESRIFREREREKERARTITMIDMIVLIFMPTFMRINLSMFCSTKLLNFLSTN